MLALKFNSEGHMGIYRNYPWGQSYFRISRGGVAKTLLKWTSKDLQGYLKHKKGLKTYFKSK